MLNTIIYRLGYYGFVTAKPNKNEENEPPGNVERKEIGNAYY